ncbi:MAG: hypothetical protein H6933_16015 [Burkholderiaceae bacterium]|nr:hypothetical protein [Rhodoferax sp.]MCP5285537.1 hypothetical protein [Burkholderiaceae bacterium]MCP5286392.1 hypothetical protein [Burkholderiaceae bacterium]
MNAATESAHLRADAQQQTLRQLGALAHQARATLRAADRFVAQGGAPDLDTASWLVSTAVDLAHEVAGELDGLARGLRETGAEGQQLLALAPWRRAAHQLHAACRAADLFLEQESRDDRDAGTWLVASARNLADRLAAALDDGVGARAAAEPVRRVAAPVRGTAA